jgi:hypothetical protein
MHIPGTLMLGTKSFVLAALSRTVLVSDALGVLCRGFAQAFSVAGTTAGERGKAEEHVSFLLFVASRYQGRPYSWPDAIELAERECPLWRTIVIAKEE